MRNLQRNLLILFILVGSTIANICENTKECAVCKQECSDTCEGRYTFSCQDETFKSWSCSCDKTATIITWLTIALAILLFAMMGLSFGLYLYRRNYTNLGAPPPPRDVEEGDLESARRNIHTTYESSSVPSRI
eukprot:TRINITY_DN1509_c0_g1_i1.p1 TRINITY_DN1509_c0_g1~~TRINITY_DN1509_c0_g1_i1.p1  ORF type:complete len:133 (-),score=29.06 TRINITY_DN1509_c0_g1_i1:39-437(-)